LCPSVWRYAKRLRETVVDRLITISSVPLFVNQGGDKVAPAVRHAVRGNIALWTK
jgi:hypothetical protein